MKNRAQNLFVLLALSALSILVFQPSPAFAQGTAFTYQGRLDDSSAPANGWYDMTFTLYATNAGGSPVAGPVTNSAVGVTNGLFTTSVNFGNPFSGASNWLEVAVSTNGANAFNTLAPRQQLTPVPYAIAAQNLVGTVGNAGLAGIYGNQLSFSNSANQFTGNFVGAGGGLTGLNASQLASGTVPSAALNNSWKTTGNSGTTPGANYIGTSDNQPLELRADNQRGLRLEPGGSNSVNLIGGWSGNGVVAGVAGATIGGGGAGNYFGLVWSNQVASDFGTVSGGTVNLIQAGARYANIGGGWQNTIQTNAYSSTVSGGENNTIESSAYESTIAGGFMNVIEPGGQADAIGGGDYNTIEPGILDAVIGGGHVNLIQSNSWFSTIAGGQGNTIQTNDNDSTISGGGGNLVQTASGSATIAGGSANMILSNATFTVISGGLQNVIQNDAVECTISGGRQNSIQTNSPDSAIGGGLFNTIEPLTGGSVIAGGYGNVIQHDPTQFANSGFANVSGGLSNSVSGYGGTVAGGVGNTASATYATTGGGDGNTASGWASTVGGGAANTASSPDGSATVGGGYENTANGDSSTVGGGLHNNASDVGATVAGGIENAAGGYGSTVAGGANNSAPGDYSFAAGTYAQALYDNSFVWSDSSSESFASTTTNQFAVRAAGGILFAGDVQLAGGATAYHNLSLSGGNSLGYLYASYPALGDGIHLGYNFYYDAGGTGHVRNPGGGTSRLSVGYGYFGVYVGGANVAPTNQRIYADINGVTVNGTFNNLSDRNAKQNFTPVSSVQMLEKVAQLPVSEWSYKEDPNTRHVGPVAQDFYASFNIGTDDKHIAPIDEGGVALAAIQGLDQKVETGNWVQGEKIQAQAAQIQSQAVEIANLKKQNDLLAQRLDELEQAVKTVAERH
ncbi:MAG TPA: tail fiber domain-containing protein [Verrucomicrobiae bacterium]|nr:tail fiber domain-containing protein [Verrucomicrobiae bacterium]